MSDALRVTVWNEYRDELRIPLSGEVYPDGMHAVIADGLAGNADMTVRTATLDEPEHGLTEEVLANTDVLTWWAHVANGEVSDEVAKRVRDRVVLGGMGLIVMHSAHYSKPFVQLMGTSCSLKWREAGEKERLWVIEPGHPIAEGLGEYVELPETEMYGERFDVPQPDATVFTSWFEGGEVFRSGCCWQRGRGKVFYFRPGHETYPIFYNPEIRQILTNAVRWAAPVGGAETRYGNVKALEDLS
jgi:trehalose utilization protein